MKKVAVLQSNYIPWKGYFDLIAAVDEFIIYDDMQYTRRDWRNRNRIKTPHGLQWLSIPVQTKGKFLQKIRDTESQGSDWAALHWKALEQYYRRALHYEEISSIIKPLYLVDIPVNLSQINNRFLKNICEYLGITTKITNSWDYVLSKGKTERLKDLVLQAGGAEYISGPAAKGYIDEQVFIDNNIKLTWFDYDSYPEYPQLWGEFIHEVSIIDLLFNTGKEAPRYMRYVSK